jgi:hypothetical protein
MESLCLEPHHTTPNAWPNAATWDPSTETPEQAPLSAFIITRSPTIMGLVTHKRRAVSWPCPLCVSYKLQPVRLDPSPFPFHTCKAPAHIVQVGLMLQEGCLGDGLTEPPTCCKWTAQSRASPDAGHTAFRWPWGWGAWAPEKPVLRSRVNSMVSLLGRCEWTLTPEKHSSLRMLVSVITDLKNVLNV